MAQSNNIVTFILLAVVSHISVLPYVFVPANLFVPFHTKTAQGGSKLFPTLQQVVDFDGSI